MVITHYIGYPLSQNRLNNSLESLDVVAKSGACLVISKHFTLSLL